MIPCAEIVSRASIINTWKILGDYQVFVENTRESLLTLASVADSSSGCRWKPSSASYGELNCSTSYLISALNDE